MTFVDTVPLFGDGQRPLRGAAAGFERQRVDLRQADGIHLSSAGARRLARVLLDLIDEEIQATTPDDATTAAR